MDKEIKPLSKSRIACKKWEEKNKEKMDAYWKNRYANNKDAEIARCKEWRRKNPEKHKATNAAYAQKTKTQRSAYWKKRRKTHPETRIRNYLSTRLCTLLKKRGTSKNCSILDLIGCSLKFLKNHIQSQFLKGMTWKNQGRKHNNWQIDHIKPCYAFDLTDIEQQKLCFHYTNLRPLWAPDNWKKNKYWDPTSSTV